MAADTDRNAGVEALGLDETLFVRSGTKHFREWETSIVDVGGDEHPAKLIGLLEAGDPNGDVPMAWHAKETLRGFWLFAVECGAV